MQEPNIFPDLVWCLNQDMVSCLLFLAFPVYVPVFPKTHFKLNNPDSLLCSLSACFRISTEHSPKLQIRSHSYLRAVSEVSINRSLDTLDPKTLLDPKMLLSSPQYRSRNESYMRAMSTISQVGRAPPYPLKGYISSVTKIPACKQKGVH